MRTKAKNRLLDLREFDVFISDVRTRKWMGGGSDSFIFQLEFWTWADELDENNSH